MLSSTRGFLMTNSYKQRLLHQCSPLHIFSGVFLFSFFFLETQTLSGVDDQDVVTPCHVIVIDCFSTDFIAKWKQRTEMIHVLTFLSFENQLPLLPTVKYSKRNQKTVGQTLASHFWRLIYPSFSQSRIRHKWKCNR